MDRNITENATVLVNVPDGAVSRSSNTVMIDAAKLAGSGATFYRGSGAPAPGLGQVGDLYVDETTTEVYGPKTGGGWGAASTVSVDPTTIDHGQLQNSGTVSHASLDAHVADTSNIILIILAIIIGLIWAACPPEDPVPADGVEAPERR